MLRSFNALAKDGDSVRMIFEHFRNLGIAAVILGASKVTGAAIWAKDGSGISISAAISTSLIVVLGVTLFLLNFRHGSLLLEARVSSVWKLLAIKLVYAWFIYALWLALAGFDMTLSLNDLIGRKS